jgi:hypothetical protein
MFKPGDLAVFWVAMSLWETPGQSEMRIWGPSKFMANKDDIVIIVDYDNECIFTQILHTEHGLKWVANASLKPLKRAKSV